MSKYAEALAALLDSDIGRQALIKLADGQGVETEEGKAWLDASSMVKSYKANQDGMVWPKGRDVARLEDMSPSGHLRVLLDNDNDVLVEVFDGENFATVEFCTPGGGGGKSTKTREALLGVMVAMEADNDVVPGRSHPRFGGK